VGVILIVATVIAILAIIGTTIVVTATVINV
jgi:hypothetical protein